MAVFRGIVFDKDGTLFDFQSSWARWTGRLIRDLSGGIAELEARLADASGYDLATGQLRPDSIVIAHTERESADALMRVMPAGTPKDLAIRKMRSMAGEVENVPAVPLPPLLSQLSGRGLRLGVATNDSEEAAVLHLRSTGVSEHFDFIAGYDSGFGAKPGPGQLLAFADTIGVDPAEAVMVGDSRHDLIAGKAAGMRTIGVLTGLAEAADLLPLADAVLPDIGRLPEWLDTI